MSDIKCPSCGYEQRINHEDGYGYEEEEIYEQMCCECTYEFEFETIISYDYKVYCADDDHELEPTTHSEVYRCKNCDLVHVELTDD